MSTQLLKVEVNDKQEQVVSGRMLHEFLEINTPYTMWFNRMLSYGFNENIDYITDNKNVRRADGTLMPQMQINHILKLSMAKELCMLSRTEKGKEARHYFIQCEESWNSPEKVMARALQLSQRELENHRALISHYKKQIEENQPLVNFANTIQASRDCILVRELAKLIKQRGFDTGEKRLFKWLRENNFLIKARNDDYNKPTQKAMNMGLFEVDEQTYKTAFGIRINTTPLVTPKGQIYFINKFIKQ